MSEIRDKGRKKLVDFLEEWLSFGDDKCITEDVVDDILNPEVFPEIAVVDREAKLPDLSINWNNLSCILKQLTDADKSDIDMVIKLKAERMLKGWVKEE